jgi:3'-5' exoribonuclease 1
MNYIIVDLEATCEKDNKVFQNEIIEIGAVKVSETL